MISAAMPEIIIQNIISDTGSVLFTEIHYQTNFSGLYIFCGCPRRSTCSSVVRNSSFGNKQHEVQAKSPS